MKKRRRFDYQEKTFHKWTPESATHHNLKYQAVTKAQSGTPENADRCVAAKWRP